MRSDRWPLARAAVDLARRLARRFRRSQCAGGAPDTLVIRLTDALAAAERVAREAAVDRDRAVLVQRQLWAALERERLRTRKALHCATRDPLTGLANRRLLFVRLQQALREAGDGGGRVGVIVFDLDGFKGINDRYGHAAGDQLLVRVARIAEDVVGNAGLVARLGGDEFVVLLPALTDDAMLTFAAAKVRARIADADLTPSGGSKLGLSYGTAHYPIDGSAADKLLSEADRRMYLKRAAVRRRNALARGDVIGSGVGCD